MDSYNYILTSDGELYHYGVKGMKWGKRMTRSHAGPGRYAGAKRQLAGDKRDLEALERGEHLSVGLNKKRQAALDKRDKTALEKRIAKNEAKLKTKRAKRGKTVVPKILAGAAGGIAVKHVLDTYTRMPKYVNSLIGGVVAGTVYNELK